MKQHHISSEHTNAPLSGAYEANGLVYLSGQVHTDDDWNLIGDTVEERFGIIMKRIEGVLAEAGLTKNDIIRVQIYLVDISELPALNKVYVECFSHPMPARTAIGVTALPLGASLEIDVVASR